MRSSKRRLDKHRSLIEDAVNHPRHYGQYRFEVIKLTRLLGFNLGNAAKYILRAPYKGNERQDYLKAAWYIKDLLEHTRSAKELEAQFIGEVTIGLLESYHSEGLSRVVLACANGDREELAECIRDLQDCANSI